MALPDGGEAEETPEKPEDTAPEAAEISEKPETPEKSAEPKRRKNGVKHIMDAAAEKLDVFFEKVNDAVDRVCATKAWQASAAAVGSAHDFLYRRAYILGAKLLRNMRRSRRRSEARRLALRANAADSWRRFWARSRLRWLNFWNRKTVLLHSSRVAIKLSVNRIRSAKELGRSRLAVTLTELPHMLWALIKPLLRVLATLFNYAAPVAAALLLVAVIQYFGTLTFGFSVEYDGEVIGYVENETKFDEAERMVKERLLNERYLQPTDSIPKFTICVIDKDKFTSVEALANRIIGASGNDVQTAYGLYVDDVFVGATDDSTALLDMLNSRLEAYRTGAYGETVSFVNKIRLAEGVYPSTSVLPLGAIEQQLNSEVEGERYYTVVKGDSPIRIANKNNMSLADLVALNPDIMDHVYGGDEILISKSEPFLGVKVTRRETYQIEVPYGTDKESDPKVYNGITTVKSPGVPGVSEQIADVTYIDGMEVERSIVSTTEITAPVNEVVSVGTYLPKPSAGQSSGGGGSPSVSTSFIRPIMNGVGYVSCGFMGYAGHTGMDIACPRGTPIYASAPGTVVFVKRLYWGYGLHVKIDHGGGVATLYAHCSNIFVSAGEYVNQGQHIAAVGMTGRATGPHLHFEIQINGVARNPANYIGNK